MGGHGLFRRFLPVSGWKHTSKERVKRHEEVAGFVEMLHLEVVAASPSDIDIVLGILDKAAAWNIDRKFPHMWVPGGFSRETFLEQISRREVYIGLVEGIPAGTFVLQWSDAFWWGEQPPEAGYIHKLAIKPAYSGQGVGRQMLAWAEARTKSTGRKLLRLNCMAEDRKIREYYERAGFIRVRDVMGPRALATLYEKPL